MKKKKDRYPAIPTPGAILKYLVRATGLPTAEIEGVSDTDFARLASGDEMSTEKFLTTVTLIVNRLVSPDVKYAAQAQPSDEALRMSHPDNKLSNHFLNDKDGAVVWGPAELARLIQEFTGMNWALRKAMGPHFVGPQAREVWIKVFVVPYLASKTAELKAIGVDWESGMPGAQHWYLPAKITAGKKKGLVMAEMPTQQVLRWWEDLLGTPFSEILSELCAGDPDNAQRQVHKWLQEGKPLGFSTIERWTQPHRRWNYAGSFSDDPSARLEQRWEKCRAFLEVKGMITGPDWRHTLAPDQHGDALRKAYRGEPLEQEIPPFSNADIPFSVFFDSPDPVAAKLPVEELIYRVACRWREPTNLELKARLMIASAAQRAITDMKVAIGTERTINATSWFAKVFDTIRPIIASDEHSREGMTCLDILRRDFTGQPFELAVLEPIFQRDPLPDLVGIMSDAFESISTDS